MRQPTRLPLVFEAVKLSARVKEQALPMALLAPMPAALAQQARTVPQSKPQIELSFAPLVKSVAPAVVNIFTRKVVQRRASSPLFDDPFFRRFFGDLLPPGTPRERMESSLGSGVLVSADGRVVTNHHVIKGSDEITVVLADRREFVARIVQSDKRTDLAVLQVDSEGEALPFLELGDSDDLEVGDLVLAIGNPFGVGQTVTSGIVSALARTGIGISDFRFFIQTDAAINPGNSGGAMVDMSGRLVGVNTAIFSRSGGSQGVGFAVPSNMVRTVLASVDAGGELVRPWVGVEGQTVTADIAASLGLKRPAGVLINQIHLKGPAAKAGLRVGDVVMAINGRPTDDPQALRFRFATLPVGGGAQLQIRRGERTLTLDVALVPAPEDPPRNVTAVKGRNPLHGSKIANLSPALVEEMSFNGPWSGVIILEIDRSSIAARLGFRPGDVVLEVNDRPVESVAGLLNLLRQPAEAWHLAVRRGDRVLKLKVDA
jgi:serine protease Do